MCIGRWIRSVSLAALVSANFGVARAQDYPSHPVKLISDSAPGSAIDITMRIIADGLSHMLGQQAVLVNQPGAGGSIAVHAASAAAPDGYTLGMMALSDFITLPGTADNLPIQLPRDFIAVAKKRPGELAYGTNGPGRLTHLTGESLQQRAGIKLLMVPYSGGTPQVLNDMMGKRIALALDSYSGIAGAIEAGNAIPLAVAAPKRMALMPDLPTVAETLPGYESEGWQILLAPVGTPDAIVQKVNAALIKAMNDPVVAQRLERLGRDHPPMSPAETLAFVKREQAKWAPILAHIDITR